MVEQAGIIVKEAEDKGVKVIDLKRPRLTRENLIDILEDKNPSFLFFNAHGDEKTIYGDKTGKMEESLIKEGENHELLNSRLVFARYQFIRCPECGTSKA